MDYRKYFLSQTAEYVFYLTQLDGETRVRKLGIKPCMYSNTKAATTWRNDIMAILEAEHHYYAEAAKEYLEEIYQLMITRA